MLNDARTWPRVALVIGKTGEDAYALMITDVQTHGRGDYVVTVELPSFGFTREDLKALSRCADNAQRWASARMYDSEDHAAHERTRAIIQRIAALLPPK